MKSFFKKLAFVMAMAMVVSLAAPAAANAATVLQAAEQVSKEVVTVWATSNVGDTKDLCFLGAPEGWRDLERGWKSSNEAVVTVDNDGLMTTTGFGTATVTFSMEGCEDAKVTVIVTEPKPVNEYELAQATEKAFTLTYANDVKYTLDDVQLFMVYENAADPENPIEIKWPINKAASKVEKNVITIAPFVAFTDGQNYKLVVDGCEKNITVKIGAIDDVVIAEKNNKIEVYANEEEGDFFLEYGVKLYSQGVDLTNLYINEVDVEYTVVADNEDEVEWDEFEDNTAKVYFWKEGVTAVVSAKVTDEDDRVIPSNSIPASSVAQPVWKLVGVTDWIVVPETEKNADGTYKTPAKVDWSKSDELKSVPADVEDGDYIIVLKLIDSRNVEYVSNISGANTDNDAALEYEVFDDADVISDAELTLQFYSADTDTMLVDEEGRIGVYKECEAVYYVGLVDGSGDYDVEKYIWADTLEVTEGRRLDKVTADKDTVEVVSKTLTGYSNLATATVTMTAKDQYNTACPGVTYTVDTDNDNVDKAIAKVFTIADNKITVNGVELNSLNVSSVKVTVTGKANNVTRTDSFVVTVKNPNKADADSNPLFVEEGIEIDTESKNRYATHTKVTIKVDDIDLNAKDSEDGYMDALITLYKTSNGATVGQYVESDNEFLIATHKDDLTKPEFTTEGARYVVVKLGNTVVGNVDWTEDGKQLYVNLARPDDTTDEMEYDATGTYTVEVVTVRYRTINGTINTTKRNDYAPDEDFVVTNTTPEVKFDKRAVDTYTKTDLAEIVVETLAFTRGGAAWTITKDMIAKNADGSYKIDTVEVGDYIIIKSVTFNVPIDGADTELPFYTKTIENINVSVKAK